MSAKKLTKTDKDIEEKANDEPKPAKATTKPGGKKKLVVSFKNLLPDIVDLVKEKYPKGYADVLMKIDKGNGNFFYAITLDTEDVDYLIKVDVKIDSEMEEVERALFGGGDQDGGGDDEFPDGGEDSFDQVADDDE